MIEPDPTKGLHGGMKLAERLMHAAADRDEVAALQAINVADATEMRWALGSLSEAVWHAVLIACDGDAEQAAEAIHEGARGMATDELMTQVKLAIRGAI